MNTYTHADKYIQPNSYRYNHMCTQTNIYRITDIFKNTHTETRKYKYMHKNTKTQILTYKQRYEYKANKQRQINRNKDKSRETSRKKSKFLRLRKHTTPDTLNHKYT